MGHVQLCVACSDSKHQFEAHLLCDCTYENKDQNWGKLLQWGVQNCRSFSSCPPTLLCWLSLITTTQHTMVNHQ